MIISFSTLSSGYAVTINNAFPSDGQLTLQPAVGGGRCADGSYVRNFYGSDMLGAKVRFSIQVTKTEQDLIEYLARNYSEFSLSHSGKIDKVGIESYNFGTGNDTITFVVLQEDI